MSDLGGHDNDVMFQVMDVRYPLTIEAVSPMGKAHPELAPATMTVTYEFPARGSEPPFKLFWYQGEGRPPQFDASQMSDRGALFIGDRGILYSGGRGGPRLLPEEKFKDYPTPAETLPRSAGMAEAVLTDVEIARRLGLQATEQSDHPDPPNGYSGCQWSRGSRHAITRIDPDKAASGE